MKVAILNGPNLNLLGSREPGIYGNFTLDDIEKKLRKIAVDSGRCIELVAYQSNIEGELINFIHKSKQNGIDYIIFNPGAYTHTSIALHDAISGVDAKVIEVHISNIHKRESFREFSYISKVSIGQIVGFGINSYILAMQYIAGLAHE